MRRSKRFSLKTSNSAEKGVALSKRALERFTAILLANHNYLPGNLAQNPSSTPYQMAKINTIHEIAILYHKIAIKC